MPLGKGMSVIWEMVMLKKKRNGLGWDLAGNYISEFAYCLRNKLLWKDLIATYLMSVQNINTPLLVANKYWLCCPCGE